MDYYILGQRIRKARKILGLSQEELAEKVGISVTHMSHIETGNTKLSLPVFVSISQELNIKTDELLHDNLDNIRDVTENEILEILSQCTAREICILSDIIKAVKKSLDRYSEK